MTDDDVFKLYIDKRLPYNSITENANIETKARIMNTMSYQKFALKTYTWEIAKQWGRCFKEVWDD